jgi:chromosome condensin MukBEF MukE localization factor
MGSLPQFARTSLQLLRRLGNGIFDTKDSSKKLLRKKLLRRFGNGFVGGNSKTLSPY